MLSRFGLGRLLCGLLVVVASAPDSRAQLVAYDLVREAGVGRFSSDRPTTGHFTVMALRVEFEPDTTPFTTGDGTFASDPFDGLEAEVDPLPHDEAFFGAHLTALSHYAGTVSDGQVELTTILLPGVVQVSRKMEEYTPVGLDAASDEQLSKLSVLVNEAWSLADKQIDFVVPPEVDPDRIFFVLFHAGVGRDIELVGTTLDKTPLDIPSIFFSNETLARLGTPPPTFRGLTVHNSVVIPRTETRRGFNYILDEPFLVELSTNGLLAASFLNFLGVPDLFNTATGESAIGPFGLMDPLGIFAYGGLIPPEPSAWTKVFLGWAVPVEVRDDLPTTLLLRAVTTASSDVARVWVSDSEYFLVENRFRDAGSDGLVLQVWRDGVITEQRVANGDPEFNSRTIEGFGGGVVVGVDEYDWALPGGLDEQGSPLLGGILIWHIDERRIVSGIESNTVNADPTWRGVDLEEADSGQDLGYPSAGVFGPELDLGSPFDFFYEGNPITVITSSGREVTLYHNRFGDDTFPDSRTNSGGPSFVEIRDFSRPGMEMTAVVQRAAGESAELLEASSFLAAEAVGESVKIESGSQIKWCSDAAEPFYAFAATVGEAEARAVLFGDDEGFLGLMDQHPIADARIACSGDRVLALSVASGEYSVVRADPRSGDVSSAPTGISVAAFSPASPIIVAPDQAYVALSGIGDGMLLRLSLDGSVLGSVSIAGAVTAAAYAGGSHVALAVGETVRLIDDGGTTGTEWHTESAGVAGATRLAFGQDADGLLGVAAGNDGLLALLYDDGGVLGLDPAHTLGGPGFWGPAAVPHPVLEDLDGDGRLDVVLATDRGIVAFTRGGAVVEGFPIQAPDVASAQVLTFSEGVGALPAVLVASADGYVYAYRPGEGRRVVAGFPIPAGPAVSLRGSRLYSASTSGRVSVWRLSSSGTPRWSESFGSSANRSFVTLESDGASGNGAWLLVAAETYNWPNPATDGRTNFRVATTEDVTLTITIVDMAGGLVDKLAAPLVRAGAPYELTWIADVQSGLYLARVSATSVSGREDSRLVRVAVIR